MHSPLAQSKIPIWLCALWWLLSGTQALALTKVNFEEVETEGRGASAQESVDSALVEAVGRVNGKTISAENALSTLSSRSNENGESKSASVSVLAKAYQDSTSGVIDGYEVLSQLQTPQGLWVSRVKARVAKLTLSKDMNRLTLAILPFSVDDRVTDAERLATIFSASLVEKLTSTRRFAILDRDFEQAVVSEKRATLTNAATSASEILRLSQDIATDYLVVGSILNANYQLKEIQLPNMRQSITLPIGTMNVQLRILDIASRQVKLADTAMLRFEAQDFERLGRAGHVPTNPQLAMSQLASEAMTRKIIDAIYPLLIIQASGSLATLNQGGDLIQSGSIYAVYETGEKLYDPYIKEYLGRQETEVGRLKIDRVSAKTATATLLENLRLPEGDLNKRYVARLVSIPQSTGSKTAQEVKQKLKEKKERHNDDW